MHERLTPAFAAVSMLAGLAGAMIGAPAAAQDCDRDCIIGVTDTYLAALATNDPGAAPLADDVAFVENVKRLEPGEGLWSSATGGPTDFAIYVPDPVLQSAGWVGVIERDGEPALLALRLKLDGGKITEAEHIVASAAQGNMERLRTPRSGLVSEIPEGRRLSHKTLLVLGSTYYDALDDNDGSAMPFADDCERHENGMITAGPNAGPGPNADPDRAPVARDCAGQLDSQTFTYIDRIENRRMIAADPVTGLVMGLSHFRHPMDNLPYTVTHEDGSTSERTKENMPFDPFDMPAAHIFKIGPEGEVHEIEAIGVVMPYNSPTGWESDAHAQDAQPRSGPASGAAACGDLMSAQVANTTLSVAEVVAAGEFRSPTAGGPGPSPDYSSLPAFCRVAGSIRPVPDSDIRFELWLPVAGWNGKFLQTGNGAAAGSIVYGSLVDPLRRGYAVANTDTGHVGAGGDFSWAAGHPEKLTDYQYRAVHALTVVGKGLTEAFYAQAPEKSYWNGCSTGGRQGLKEAQRYPDDYDAIIAGAPANNWSALMSLSILTQVNLGPGGLAVDKLGLVSGAAVAACDADDGVTDRVIGIPGTCDFDPASLQCESAASDSCLTEQEVAAARRLYAGVVGANDEVAMPGTGPGSEALWAASASPSFMIGTSYMRNVVMNDPDWDPATFDTARDLARMQQADAGATVAMDPDLSAFVGHGGKLLLYHGTADGLIPYGNTINYYASVVDEIGAQTAADSVRLYLVPGMSHCSGGEGAYAVDWLTALEQWDAQGTPPGALRGEHPAGPAARPSGDNSSDAFTRPICPYPQVAMYRGSGDDTDAGNFTCSTP